MQCPKCDYDPSLSEVQRSPNDCTACGINYEAYQKHLDNQSAIAAERSAAKRAAEAELANMPAAARSVRLKYPGIEPVVVVDVRMGFWSMVVFMVKWALASIPAILILVVLVVASVSFLAGFVGGLGQYALGPKSAGHAATEEFIPPEQIESPGAPGSFWLISLRSSGDLVHMITRTDFDDGRQVYTEFAVNCMMGRGVILRYGSSIATLKADTSSTGYESVQPGTPRHAIARRGCREASTKHEIFN